LTLGIVRFVRVMEGTNKIVTRYGKYHRSLTPGLQSFLFLWGLLGKVHKFEITDLTTQKRILTDSLDIKEQVYHFPKEQVISRDNVQFEVQGVIFFRVLEPQKALFTVTDYTASLRTVVKSVLRAEIGKHNLKDVHSNRTQISEELTREADRATDEWGIRIFRLEIKEFELGEFAEQLLRQTKQEIEKQQHTLQIEAIKERAAAEAEALRMKFEAEAAGYQTIAGVLKANPHLAYYLKLHTAENISKHLSSGQSTKVFLPNNIEQLLNTFSIADETPTDKKE